MDHKPSPCAIPLSNGSCIAASATGSSLLGVSQEFISSTILLRVTSHQTRRRHQTPRTVAWKQRQKKGMYNSTPNITLPMCPITQWHLAGLDSLKSPSSMLHCFFLSLRNAIPLLPATMEPKCFGNTLAWSAESQPTYHAGGVRGGSCISSS